MTPPSSLFPDPSDGLDKLVRAHLDAESARVDASMLWSKAFDQLQALSLATTHDRQAKSRGYWHVALVSALAASLLLAMFLFPGGQRAVASPAEVVREARVAFILGQTRQYRVTIVIPPREIGIFARIALDSGVRTLSTRGDRFVVEPGFAGKGKWGRDAAGHIWIVPSDGTRGAARFEENELPAPLRNAIKIYELHLDTLLDEVLVDFDLTWHDAPNRDARIDSITANRREPAPMYRIASANLLIEKETKVIRSLAIRRMLHGNSAATITFTLVGSVEVDDAAFTAEGSIAVGAPIFDRTRPLLRRKLLLQQLGEVLGGS